MVELEIGTVFFLALGLTKTGFEVGLAPGLGLVLLETALEGDLESAVDAGAGLMLGLTGFEEALTLGLDGDSVVCSEEVFSVDFSESSEIGFFCSGVSLIM